MNLTIGISVIGGVSLIGEAIILYVTLKLRADLLQMRQDILEECDRTYVRKDVLQAQMSRP